MRVCATKRLIIDDAGFTARVVQKLPARPVRQCALARSFLLGVTLVASVIAYLLSGGGWFIAEGVTRLRCCRFTMIWLGAAAVTALVMAGGLAVAMSKTGARLSLSIGVRVSEPNTIARFRHVSRDLRGERFEILEFLFRPEIAQESHFDFFTVDVLVQIEEVQFEQPLRLFPRLTVGR